MDLRLAGRRIAVAGAGAGIGRSVALELAREGVRLALGSRSGDSLAQIARECSDLGGDVVSLTGDLSTSSAAESLVASAVHNYGGLDGLVCCVGSTPMGSFADLDDDVWIRSFESKFLSTVRAIRFALPVLRQSSDSRVVVVAGNSTFAPDPDMVTSAVANASLGALVSALARQYAEAGIGFVCVDPGPTDTRRLTSLRSTLAKSHHIDEAAAAELIRSRIPTGRVTTPDEVAATIAVCLSPRLAQVTGTRVVIDGAATWVGR